MKLIIVVLYTFLLGFASAESLVVPGDSQDKEGEAFIFPFRTSSQRSQYLIPKENFKAGMPEGAYIESISFRFDAPNRFRPTSFSTFNVQLYLSTTPITVEQISTTFRLNYGQKIEKLFDGPFTANEVLNPSPPSAFSVKIPFSTPYFYNPSDGNLLIELKVKGGTTDPFLDAERGNSALLLSDYDSEAANFPVFGIIPIISYSFTTVPEPKIWSLGIVVFTLIYLSRGKK